MGFPLDGLWSPSTCVTFPSSNTQYLCTHLCTSPLLGSHIDLSQRLHRRLLPEIRRLSHGSQDFRPFHGWRFRPDVRYPDVQQVEPQMGQHAPRVRFCAYDADSICVYVVSTLSLAVPVLSE